FSETTMTPGRRALFLLKLILAESDDKWPILIDQPEENLDSKSIIHEVVPYLRKQKKKRQIIMASHNANFVIGADSEQIIVANRNGSDSPNEDGKTFNYLSGSIEDTKEKDSKIKDTLKRQGIKEHACLILDGGKEAFEHRKNKYNI
ncbi:MAG: ATP-binding protein, partial [Candidatus Omnitrophica bacterium]|nr:ATP-binding protein [Candidatus Omnitrophota bacterium]